MKSTQHSAFYTELAAHLPTAYSEQRTKWVSKIISDQLSLCALSSLLLEDKKVAIRYLWLMSDVGLKQPSVLREHLPCIFDFFHAHQLVHYLPQFASYWRIVGVPAPHEAIAIDYLFLWLNASSSNVTTKSRALDVLFGLTQKHPDLYPELCASIKGQMNRYSPSFRRRCEKMLLALDH